MPRRQKISTTISVEAYAFLQNLVKAGEAETLAEAVDQAISRLRRIENRRRLEQDTASYYEALSGPAESEEAELGSMLGALPEELPIDD